MKSSTLYRSNLSRERMAVLEGNKVKPRNFEKNLGEYVRPAREKELDVLWQNFKMSNLRREKTPAVYLMTGFIAGALCVLLLTGVFAFASRPANDLADSAVEKKIAKEEKTNVTIIPADNSANISQRTETYTIKSGDTLDKIVVRFYGKYDAAKIKEIQEVNNLASPHMLQIGQVLTIPIDEP